jgi:hypothetical protein
MPFAVALYVDSRADAAVRQIWQSLVEAGITSQPLSAGTRPHVSFCLYESLDSRIFPTGLETFARKINPFAFVLESVETFPASKGVVFLRARSSEELLEVHGRFHKDLPALAQQSPLIIFRSIGNCTVAENLSSNQVSHAIECCRNMPLPIRERFCPNRSNTISSDKRNLRF